MIEIDKGVLPWSAIHLRSREIEGKLLSELAKASQSSTSDSDLNHIEEYALLAVMLETGRPLAQSIEIRYESSPTGNLGFIPAGSPCQSFWAWKTIEPLYRSEHDQVSEMEVTRPPYLFFPVHTVADRLLRLWNTLRLTREPQLFSRPLDQYREGIRSRLHSLDSTGRLTMIKIARLKWTIMSQINGGELAEASLVFGRPDPAVNVQLYYSLMPLKTTTRLFREATAGFGEAIVEVLYKSARMDNENNFTGSRGVPTIKSVTSAIAFVREHADHLASIAPSHRLSSELVPVYNFAIIYLLWHQFFSIGTRGIRLPYVPLTEVSTISGLGTLADKDSGDGYKARLTWMRPELLTHMVGMELLVENVARSLGIVRAPADAKLFFLDDSMIAGKIIAGEITPSGIEGLTSTILPFPSNTPRHVMRFLLRESGATNEVVEAFMGHWQAGREPWGKYSTFDYSAYLKDICVRIPKILDGLGFTVPQFRRSFVRHH